MGRKGLLMNIITRDFGEITIKLADIIFFPEGLYAFEDETEFVLLNGEDASIPARWLQSVKTPELCFIVFDAYIVMPNYAPLYSDKELRILDCEDKSRLEYYLIAVIPNDFANTTVNLKSPIVFNKAKNKAKQIILDNVSYPIKYPLFQNERRCTDADCVEKD